jgi:hypothetical protein
MNQQAAQIRQALKTPRAAALAGILFSVLLIASQVLIGISIPANPMGAATEVISHSKIIALALRLVPFAGIAFLWFIAVVRDRLGELEDRFFATVFLGSGLLYVAMMFISTALAGGLIRVLGKEAGNIVQSGAYALGRAEIYQITQVYGTKMAGVFMISTCTILLRTRTAPRWITFLGYALALILLLSIGTVQWISLVFPAWVFLVSLYILIENLR